MKYQLYPVPPKPKKPWRKTKMVWSVVWHVLMIFLIYWAVTSTFHVGYMTGYHDGLKATMPLRPPPYKRDAKTGPEIRLQFFG